MIGLKQEVVHLVINADLFMESKKKETELTFSIDQALELGDKIGRNRQNQDFLREQSSIRQSLKNREDLNQMYNDIHLDSFKLSKSCMIDRYYTQLFAADANGHKGNDMYSISWYRLFVDTSICIRIRYVLWDLHLVTRFSPKERNV